MALVAEVMGIALSQTVRLEHLVKEILVVMALIPPPRLAWVVVVVARVRLVAIILEALEALVEQELFPLLQALP